MSFIAQRYPDAEPPGPDDDPTELDTPVHISISEALTDRIYEQVCDGYMTLTVNEALRLRNALSTLNLDGQEVSEDGHPTVP